MISPDNSAQGISKVCTGIIQKSDLTKRDFFNRLQVINGDLATCSNFQSLWSQQIPSAHVEDRIDNLFTLLRGLHTLWNIGPAIFELHYRNTSDLHDCGVWRWLELLVIPLKKLLTKKTLQRWFKIWKKSTRLQLLTVSCGFISLIVIIFQLNSHQSDEPFDRCMMKIQNWSLTNELVVLPSKELISIIDKTYKTYFSTFSKSWILQIHQTHQINPIHQTTWIHHIEMIQLCLICQKNWNHQTSPTFCYVSVTLPQLSRGTKQWRRVTLEEWWICGSAGLS